MKKSLKNGLGALITLLFIFFLTACNSSSPSELVDNFTEAIQNEDVNQLMKIVEVDKDIYWTEKEAKTAISYLKEKHANLEEQMMILHAQAAYYEARNTESNFLASVYPGESIANVGAFYIHKQEGFGGSKYSLKARGYNLKVTGSENSIVTFNKEKIEINDKDPKTLGVFGPGVYTIEGEKKFDYTTVNDKTTISLFHFEEFNSNAKLNFTGDNVYLKSSTPNTSVLINGENSDLTVTESMEFGPVKDGITLQGTVEYPWGEGKSEKLKINGSNKSFDLTPNPIVNDEMKNKIKTVVNEFAKNKLTAKVKKDPNQLKNVSDNLRKQYTTIISNYNGDSYFEGEALGTRIDFSNAEYKIGSGGDQLLTLQVEFHNKSRDVSKWYSSELLEDYEEKKITLQYDENLKNWTIFEEENHYFSNDHYMTSKEVEKTKF
ncbi:TcaA 3rd/4th domain-containing protein [Metabacillus fastidiosus]|uniref:TcaA 3rd/4th domain-containing protein n=1 Tax=Metabacillus fastidiosus TaxID=1458 RepID=UPI002DBCBF38|nr:hypothetical protein [Metabacillus fastidiosus]MEC2077941.1 hypothetical protein [Metabacillus fastidiosus]